MIITMLLLSWVAVRSSWLHIYTHGANRADLRSPEAWAALTVWSKTCGLKRFPQRRQFEGNTAGYKNEGARQTLKGGKQWWKVGLVGNCVHVIGAVSKPPSPPSAQELTGERQRAGWIQQTAVMEEPWRDGAENPEDRLQWRATESSKMSWEVRGLQWRKPESWELKAMEMYSVLVEELW